MEAWTFRAVCRTARGLVVLISVTSCIVLAGSATRSLAVDWRARAAQPHMPRMTGVLYRHEPRVLRYDEAEDKFYRAHSVMAPVRTDRPGGENSYYGNRLTQFRFNGPRAHGGIYSALADDVEQRELQVRKYQYRW